MDRSTHELTHEQLVKQVVELCRAQADQIEHFMKANPTANETRQRLEICMAELLDLSTCLAAAVRRSDAHWQRRCGLSLGEVTQRLQGDLGNKKRNAHRIVDDTRHLLSRIEALLVEVVDALPGADRPPFANVMACLAVLALPQRSGKALKTDAAPSTARPSRAPRRAPTG